MVVLAVELHQLCFEVPAHAVKDGAKIIQYFACEDISAVFCDENQMNMHLEDTMPSGAYFLRLTHRTKIISDMAYGKNKARKNWQKRAIPLAVGEISAAKRKQVFELRGRVLALMREMAVAGFSQEPLEAALQGKELDAQLLAIQNACPNLNAVWREQARMRVKPALEETVTRYFKRLAGCLRYVDQVIPESSRHPESSRRFFHIPESVQDRITPEEIAALKAIAENNGAIDAFRQWRSGKHAFTECQAAVLADIHARAQDRHNVPVFGAKEDFTLQLHIDARMLPSGEKPALSLLEGAGFLLADDANKMYYRFLDLAGIEARGPRIRLPLAVSRSMAKRLDGANHQWASLIVEISQQHIGVRLVAGKPPAPTPISGQTFLGRDFGYANTITLSVARAEVPSDIDAFLAMIDDIPDEKAARDFLAACELSEGVEILERVRFEGRSFLERINAYSERIDSLKSRIDRNYNALNALKKTLVEDLGLKPEDQITPEMKRRHPQAREFFVLLGQINDLKRARRNLYRKIAAIKKAWFGFLSNVEIELAKKHNAAIVREDLTVEAIEKDAPDYKGRTFNKMINNGSKGQYQRRATDKMRWNGVPEIVIPAWYTSRVCLEHTVIVDRKNRSGEKITLPCCGKTFHADEHASDTIARYPFLRPRLTPAVPEKTAGFVTPAIPAL